MQLTFPNIFSNIKTWSISIFVSSEFSPFQCLTFPLLPHLLFFFLKQTFQVEANFTMISFRSKLLYLCLPVTQGILTIEFSSRAELESIFYHWELLQNWIFSSEILTLHLPRMRATRSYMHEKHDYYSFLQVEKSSQPFLFKTSIFFLFFFPSTMCTYACARARVCKRVCTVCDPSHYSPSSKKNNDRIVFEYNQQ